MKKIILFIIMVASISFAGVYDDAVAAAVRNLTTVVERSQVSNNQLDALERKVIQLEMKLERMSMIKSNVTCADGTETVIVHDTIYVQQEIIPQQTIQTPSRLERPEGEKYWSCFSAYRVRCTNGNSDRIPKCRNRAADACKDLNKTRR